MRRAAVIVLLALGAMRIASTWTTFSETADEPMHLIAGLQILDEQQYTIQLQNPPLPRLLIALLPHFHGARFENTGDPVAEALTKFYATGHYKTMLALARAPNVFFFLLAALALFAWTRAESNSTVALLALFFFTTQPVILGHAGLATLDVPGTTGMAVSLLAFSSWLAQPTWKRAILLGAAWGFAIHCKLLCIAYVPIACAAILIVRMIRTRGQWRGIATLLIVPLIAAAAIVIGYAFHPAPFVRGIQEMLAVNRAGFESYALGQWSLEGWWWYFPLALALKTTIAMLIVAVAAFYFARTSGFFFESMAASLAILAMSMTTHVNIGIRYILPLYVPLSAAAAAGALAMIRHRQKFVRIAVMLLLASHLLESAIAHPDYVAYFNAFAGSDPSRYLIDSNLDWGQDVLRLRDAVRREHITELGVAVFGPADLDKLGFPKHYTVSAYSPAHGWLAVSDHAYRLGRAGGGWTWLKRSECRRIGKSIRLCRNAGVPAG